MSLINIGDGMSDKNSEVSEGKYVTLSVHISYDLKDRLKFHSYKEKTSIKELVNEALEEYLLKHKLVG